MAKPHHKQRKGMTLIEVIGVMVIIAVISAIVGFSISRNVKRGNREAVESELRLYSTSLADAYYDIGTPEIDPTSPNGIAEFETYLKVVEGDYLNVAFDYSTITPETNGFSVIISAPLDVYEQHYKCWFVTANSIQKYVMVASGGENLKIEDDGYASGNYSDDLVMIMLSKV